MRILWLLLGLVSVGLAFVGSVTPILPTVPFLLLAAFAFARSSPKLEAWLLDHAHFGPLIQNWRDYGAISKPTKVISVVTMAATWLLSFVLGVSDLVLIIQAVVLSGVAVFILTRPHGPEGG